MWLQRMIETTRGEFELFEKPGEPLCVTHLVKVMMSENTFANPFTSHYQVLHCQPLCNCEIQLKQMMKRSTAWRNP
jgi:hypothetical protein